MNKIILMGRLTRDPETRNLPRGDNSIVASFGLAVNRRFTRQGEERQADFFNISTFGRTAEFCEKYFKKGQQVGIIGRVQMNTWEDDKGRHYSTDIIAEEAYFAEGRRDSDVNGTANSFPNPFGETAPGGMNSGNSGFQETTQNDLPF